MPTQFESLTLPTDLQERVDAYEASIDICYVEQLYHVQFEGDSERFKAVFDAFCRTDYCNFPLESTTNKGYCTEDGSYYIHISGITFYPELDRTPGCLNHNCSFWAGSNGFCSSHKESKLTSHELDAAYFDQLRQRMLRLENSLQRKFPQNIIVDCEDFEATFVAVTNVPGLEVPELLRLIN